MTAIAARAPSAKSGSFRMMDPRRVGHFVRIIAMGTLAASLFAQDPIAYLIVAVPVLIPPFMWVAGGALGIPTLPVVAALFYLYYAMPLLVGTTIALYKPDELTSAAISVALFLLAASIAALPFSASSRRANVSAGRTAVGYTAAVRTRSFADLASDEELFRLIFVGLAAGIFYYVFLLLGGAAFLGTYLGAVRAALLPLTSIACYLVGYGRGTGSLSGYRWLLALAGFITITVLSISGLIIVGGIINVVASVLGYSLAAKRIPWRGITIALLLVGILNAGKYSVRGSYWAPDSQVVENPSLIRLPQMMATWFEAGIVALLSTGLIGSGSRKEPTLLERTTLLHMVITAQQATPTLIPYLRGETYEMLPLMLVPRFLQSDKIETQAANNLLSVRYGIQYAETTSKTTIGWGLVAEAFANYGNLGVIVAGALFGAFSGMLMRLSAAASPISLAMLTTIASTLVLCNVEMDFCSIALSWLQTVAGVMLFAVMPRIVRRRTRPNIPASGPISKLM